MSEASETPERGVESYHACRHATVSVFFAGFPHLTVAHRLHHFDAWNGRPIEEKQRIQAGSRSEPVWLASDAAPRQPVVDCPLGDNSSRPNVELGILFRPMVGIVRFHDNGLLSCLNDNDGLSALGDMSDYPIRTPQQLGAVLRGFRRERKLTQRAVGGRAGLAQNVISLLETNPGPASLARIARVLAALDLELVVRSRKSASHDSEW